SNRSPESTPRAIVTASRIGPSVFFVCVFVLLRKILDVPKPRMKRPGPAASCTTRASIAACTGWRVDAAMIPHPIVSRSVARPISAATPVDERASMPCLRHHGYASASQIVSMPTSSMVRADSSMTSSGSMVSCITPMRNGCATELLRDRVLDFALERGQHVRDLLVDDRLDHALSHRADRAGDLHIGRPLHERASPVRVGEVERRLHRHHRPHTLALDAERSVLRSALF